MTYQPADTTEYGKTNPYSSKTSSQLTFLGEVHTGNDTRYHVIALWRADDGTFAWAAETGTITHANGQGEATPFQALTLDRMTTGTLTEFTTVAQAHISEGLARYAGLHGQTRLDDLLGRAEQPTDASQQLATTPPRPGRRITSPVPGAVAAPNTTALPENSTRP